jgi:NADH dehydrogenase (ubiquinone) 1 alpha subcomplex subunit 2
LPDSDTSAQPPTNQPTNQTPNTSDFVLNAYPEIKRANPLLPILVREAPGAEARLVARFARGAERSVSVQGKSAADVERALQDLAAQGAK